MPYAGHILLGGIMDQDQTTPMKTVKISQTNTAQNDTVSTDTVPITQTSIHNDQTNQTDHTLTEELESVADMDTTAHEETIDDATIAMQQAAQQYTQESQTHGYPGAGAADTASTNAQDAYATYPGWQQPNARTLPKTRIIPATGPSVATIVWGVILAIIGVIGLSLVAGVSLDWHISAQTWGLLAIVIFVAIGLILVVTGIAASIQASKEHKSSTTTPHTSK